MEAQDHLSSWSTCKYAILPHGMLDEVLAAIPSRWDSYLTCICLGPGSMRLITRASHTAPIDVLLAPGYTKPTMNALVHELPRRDSDRLHVQTLRLRQHRTRDAIGGNKYYHHGWPRATTQQTALVPSIAQYIQRYTILIYINYWRNKQKWTEGPIERGFNKAVPYVYSSINIQQLRSATIVMGHPGLQSTYPCG